MAVVATLSKDYRLDYMWRQTGAPGVVRDTRLRLVCNWDPGRVGIPFIRLPEYEPGA
jgi:hypothetical protein